MTPRLVSRRYSNGRVLLVVLRKGYRNSGTCAAGGELGHQQSTHLTCLAAAATIDTDRLHGIGAPLQEGVTRGDHRGSPHAVGGGIPWRNRLRVSWCDATHCRSARALHTRLEACAVRAGGVSSG